MRTDESRQLERDGMGQTARGRGGRPCAALVRAALRAELRRPSSENMENQFQRAAVAEESAMPDRTNEFAACARVLSNGQLPRAR